MNYTVEYTCPEQYIIYLPDAEIAKILKDVISDEINTNNIVGKKMIHKEGSKLDTLVETIYKEAAKRWLKKIIKL